MKAIISSTYSDIYLFCLPIVTYCWNKVGVDVVCFMPDIKSEKAWNKFSVVNDVLRWLSLGSQHSSICFFKSPEHKEATYAQCLRNFGSSIDELHENELLFTSDVDMCLFKLPPYHDKITIWGNDLVPEGQFPECYITGTSKQLREAFEINGRTYQQCIDDLLGEDECEHYRGNRWARDQEIAFQYISKVNHSLVPRAKPGTQFAQHRLDRDDAYILDRLNPDNIDFHMPRPGYEESNFSKILTVLQYHYPNDNFDWLKEYRENYCRLL